jgi:MHS family proline/betaine transporter-like MFS transporter
MIMMAAGTVCIGLVPGYPTIGIWAPVLLLGARLVQGFSTGGEYGSAMTFIAEHSPDRRRGFLASWLEVGTLAGYVLGAVLVTALTATLAPRDLLSWGWRIPFLLAGPFGLTGLYFRLRLGETPAYERMESREPGRETGLVAEVRRILVEHRRPFLVCIGMALVLNVTSYMLTSYMPSYLTAALGVPEASALMIVAAVMALLMVLVPFVGLLSDRIGRRPVLMTGCLLLVFGSVPAFMIIRLGTLRMIFLGCVLVGLMFLCFDSTEPATLPALFPTEVRSGALSVAFNISVSVFGGTTPLINESLVQLTGNRLVPGFYLAAAGAIGAVAVMSAPETAREPLPGAPAAVASRREADELLAGRRAG